MLGASGARLLGLVKAVRLCNGLHALFHVNRIVNVIVHRSGDIVVDVLVLLLLVAALRWAHQIFFYTVVDGHPIIIVVDGLAVARRDAPVSWLLQWHVAAVWRKICGSALTADVPRGEDRSWLLRVLLAHLTVEAQTARLSAIFSRLDHHQAQGQPLCQVLLLSLLSLSLQLWVTRLVHRELLTLLTDVRLIGWRVLAGPIRRRPRQRRCERAVRFHLLSNDGSYFSKFKLS